ncbi:MAG: hypothetical protein ACYS9Y_06675 [Planctomycetota bacterium]
MDKNSTCEMKPPAAIWRFWPAMLGPMTMLCVYLAKMFGHLQFFSRGTNESIALVLLSVPIIGFIVQTSIFRSEFHAFMLVLCTALFCREWHFPGTSKGIYVALAALVFWAVKRKDKLESLVKNNLLKVWLWSTFWTYVLSLLISRRAFKYVYLPAEEMMHVFLEESVETTAHLMMIVTCIIAWNKVAEHKKQSL